MKHFFKAKLSAYAKIIKIIQNTREQVPYCSIFVAKVSWGGGLGKLNLSENMRKTGVNLHEIEKICGRLRECTQVCMNMHEIVQVFLT